MSKENATRFMMMKDKDETIKNAFDAIMGKYEGKILSKDEQDKALREEIIPLAKEYGYEFTLEDFAKLQADGKLSDEELGQITGGRGEFSKTYTCHFLTGTTILHNTYSCDYAPDDQTFETRYNQFQNNNCPDYKNPGIGAPQRICINCEHMHERQTTSW